MNDRKKQLELFAKQLSEGLPFAEEFLNISPDLENNALLARNLSEDALAHQVLKNTGIPIPDNNASISKKEDFLNRIAQERYPELDANVRLGDEDSYFKNQVTLRDTPDITKTTGKLFHEKAHNFDDKALGYQGKNLDLGTLRNAKKSGIDVKNIDPAELYEIYSKGHHAQIPNLREGSFGLGALKSYLKSGNFKSIPIVGPALGAAAMGFTEDSLAAVPILGDATETGPQKGSEDDFIENPDPRMSNEERQKALKKMLEQQ